MEGPISESVIKRLPSAVKNLDETCQKTYMYLRLRKSEHEIARHLKLSLNNAREKITVVHNELSKAGQIDMIKDPQFISMHSDDPDTPDMPIASQELEIDKRLIIKEFLSSLKKAVSELPEHQSQLLKLRYKYQMTAKDILGFINNIGTSLIPGKEIAEVKEQDIFYALNIAMKTILLKLKTRYHEKNSIGLDNLKYIFEEIGI